MLNHIDDKNQPTMVDVSAKLVTTRIACAQTTVQLPHEFAALASGGEIVLKKGPVFQTAIIAGTMAVKKTSEIIPFCHAVAVEGCKIDISVNAERLVTVRCEVKTVGKTGVEMEALFGASAAALVIYDMCKAVSHNIVVRETRLLAKAGGKRTVLEKPLYGLVLTGGKSERMKTDKALLDYKGVPHAEFLRSVLAPYCEEVYLSARPRQWSGTRLETLPTIDDAPNGSNGPTAGLLAAFAKHPEANWLVVACDLPFVDGETIAELLHHFDPGAVATCFANRENGYPEPLCAIYTPAARAEFARAVENDLRCPVKILKHAQTRIIEARGAVDLANINTPEELARVRREINPA